MILRPLVRFLRFAPADDKGRAWITPRRIYIFPTAYGFAFGALLMVMLLGSINYDNNLGFLLTFLLAGIGLVTIIHTWRNLLGLELTPGRVEPVFAGQQACFEINLDNRRRGPRPGIQLQIKGYSAVIADLAGGSTGSLTLCKPSTQRGELPLQRFSVSTHYPLGLLRAWSYVELDIHCLVYPAPGPRMPQSDAPDYTQSQSGDRGVGADDFVGLRQYRQGDPPGHIDWKTLAREKGIHTKMFGGDRSERRWLDWGMLSGDVESRLSCLCRGILNACDQQLEYGLRLPDGEISPARGQIHRHHCLAALARFGKNT